MFMRKAIIEGKPEEPDKKNTKKEIKGVLGVLVRKAREEVREKLGHINKSFTKR